MNRNTLLLPLFLSVSLIGFSFEKHSANKKKADHPRVKPGYSQSNSPVFAYETLTSGSSPFVFRDNSTRGNPESDTLFLATIKKLDAVFDKTPYYTRVTNKYLYYVCIGNWNGGYEDTFNTGQFLLGIADGNRKLILPVAYTKIYNPDATAHGHVEIEANGKRGLFNYSNGKIITPAYDFIFPALLPEQIAIGKKENNHYAILKDGKEQLLAGDKIPGYSKLGSKGTFDVNAATIKHLHDSYAAPEDREYGIVFTPSYFQNLGIIPDRQYLLTKKQEELVLEGVLSSKTQVLESKSISGNLFALISSFHCKGVDVVGWETNSKTLTIIDAENKVISTKEILPTFDRQASYCSKKDGYSFPENNLLEVYRIRFSEEVYASYEKMTSYFYYKIKDNGEIEELESPRIFDCSKFVALNEQHFQGCFARARREEENTGVVSDEGNLLLSRHLSLEDLDFMIQEIYAEYGLIFKEEKWKEYFGKQDWYKAKLGNVDQFLSTTDKKNIQFIKEMKEKMKGKELKYTDRKWVNYIDMD